MISLGAAFDPERDYKYLPFMVLIAFVMLWLGWQSRHSCLWKQNIHLLAIGHYSPESTLVPSFVMINCPHCAQLVPHSAPGPAED